MTGVGISGRNPDRQMAFLLRELARTNNAYRVARPTAPPPTGLTQPTTLPVHSGTGNVRVGDWTLSQDPETGDLIATNTDGTTATVARKGGT
jgi:hypothetical protein